MRCLSLRSPLRGAGRGHNSRLRPSHAAAWPLGRSGPENALEQAGGSEALPARLPSLWTLSRMPARMRAPTCPGSGRLDLGAAPGGPGPGAGGSRGLPLEFRGLSTALLSQRARRAEPCPGARPASTHSDEPPGLRALLKTWRQHECRDVPRGYDEAAGQARPRSHLGLGPESRPGPSEARVHLGRGHARSHLNSRRRRHRHSRNRCCPSSAGH